MKIIQQRGMTLIETILYIALFSILIGSVAVSAYTLFESAGRNTASALLLNEGDFLIGKMGWALSQVNSIHTPENNASSSSLSIVPEDISLGNPIIFKQNNSNLVIIHGVNPAQILNNTNTFVSHLNFSHTHATTSPLLSDSVEISFTLSTYSDEGRLIFEDFKTIQYLRK